MEKIKTGIASFGMSGLVFHAPLLHANPQFELHSIVERSPKGSKDIYPDVNIVASFDALLADPDIELVIVNTPDTTHFEFCRMALDAGKHVVVEKPFTVHSHEAETLMSLAEERQLTLSVFQNRRWDSDYLTVKKVVQNKMLGRLVSFESHFDRYRNFLKPDTWKEESLTGAEILYNLGAHMVDQAYDLFGMPQSVFAEIGIQRSGGKADDYYNLNLKYENLSVNLKASYLVREEGPRYALHGTLGSFLKWGMDRQEDDLKAGKSPSNPDWGIEPQKIWGKLNTEINDLHFTGRLASLPGNYNAYYDNLAAVIRGEVDLIVHPKQSLDVLRIIEAAIKSDKEGIRVSF
ncbi:Gfo/Idh/MocA family oxidoreductase [Reichenbachiella agarivorans]|uniref:Gfo/Idh/MocA family oxidoreductase n=1 Tax=Reichenbachiella agarivorans TaxID=2979464 RepID=A0ABY6CK52_9BACT|nr:Gfo/Idh/MocA family oxidoreductase [Reichenbachiella agarivorans]UXP30901.1 Gfo/Idh/MocA family oxidoreductase [Reichenbachiella agarivorans]